MYGHVLGVLAAVIFTAVAIIVILLVVIFFDVVTHGLREKKRHQEVREKLHPTREAQKRAVMTKSREFYFCTVGPVPTGQTIIASPLESYRINMDAPALQAPSEGGSRHQTVISSEEYEVLLRRGFKVELIRGPFSSEGDADDSLDDWWEDSHRMGGDD